MNLELNKMAQEAATSRRPLEPGSAAKADGRASVIRFCVLLAPLAVIGLLLMPGRSDQVLYAVSRDPMAFRNYAGEVAAHRSQRVAPCTLVILGHSIGRHLDHRQFWSGSGLNYSIGGDTLAGLMARAGTYEMDGAAAVLVMIGINDVFKSDDDEVVRGFKRLLTQLSFAKVVLCAILPVDEARVPRSFTGFFRGIRTTNQRVHGINARVAGLCEDFPNVTWCDPSQELCDAKGALRSEFTEDGVHLNPDGYTVVEKCLRLCIQEAGLAVAK